MNFNSSTTQEQPSLEQLDAWSEQALSSPKPEIREEAERRLRFYFPTFSETQQELLNSHGFTTAGQTRVLAVFHRIKGPAEAAQFMCWFMHQTQKVYSLAYVVRRLRVLILNHLNVMSSGQKEDLRKSMFVAIREKMVGMPKFVVEDTSRALALVVMFTWFDQPDAKNVVGSVLEMSRKSSDTKQQLLALQILRSFVEQFNKELPSKYIAKQRRVVVDFRDKQLKDIFEHSLEVMQAAIKSEDATWRAVGTESLSLQRECLGFDFIGLAPDEASDDAVAIQIPTTWKDLIQTDGFVDPYFEGYKRCVPPLSSLCIEVLVQIASIRRSFYMESVRITFVKRMSSGIADILKNEVGLEDVENYHHVCRLMARFRCIHTLIEVENEPEYRELLVAATRFTATGLGLWEWSPNSMAPLLMFWSRISNSFDGSSSKDVAGDVIANALPQIVGGYLQAMVQATDRAESIKESPLEDTDGLVENMGLVANIARSRYAECGAAVQQMAREMAGQYQAALQSGDAQAVGRLEAQMAWPIHAMAQFISARQPYKSVPDDDRLDAEMFALGLEIDHVVQQRLQLASITSAVPPCEALELAFMQLYCSFRLAYIGEQGYKAAAVFTRLEELVRLEDTTAVLEVMLEKILFNLRTWPAQTRVVPESLKLFNDLSTGYVAVRQAAKLKTVQRLLAAHNSEQLQFLRSVDEYKKRAMYYSGLARVMFASSEGVAGRFAEFVQPWTQVVGELSKLNDGQLAGQVECLRLLRDMRGFLSAIGSKTNYQLFFKWMMAAPQLELVHRCVRLSGNPQLQIAALKLMAEFVYNRTQRMNFDVTSANGILIFREASRAIWEYGGGILDNYAVKTAQLRDVYKERYKGISVCFTILNRVVSGKYVAIGVMPLYGDRALDNAYRMAVELVKVLPVNDVIAYPKLGKAVTGLLEIMMAKSNIELVPLDEVAYEQAMRICVEAFDHAETAVSSTACGVIDAVLSAAAATEESNSDDKEVGMARQLVRSRPDITQYLLRTMLNIVLFEDRPNDWSFSRPLFCLIVLDSEFALEYTNQVVAYQPMERRDELVEALKELLSSTEFVLANTNRDRFTQALTQYRRVVAAKNLILMVPTDQTQGESVSILDKDASGKMES